MKKIMDMLTSSQCQKWKRSQILVRHCPVPPLKRVYAWYFRNTPSIVPTSNCHECNGFKLLYIGIAPAYEGSSATLRSRIRTHLRGNASGSTLRLSLGCLLRQQLVLRLQPAGRTGRLTFGDGEAVLSDWLEENALVVWYIFNRPWEIETKMIQKISVPLNLRHNERHPFYQQLAAIRDNCRRQQ